MAEGQFREIPLNLIKPNPAALRTVNRDTEQFHEFVSSIKERGVILPIVVRQKKDPDTNSTYYSLIDGLHRYTGSVEAGKDTISARVVPADDAEALRTQIVANLHTFETRPAEYAEGLKRLLVLDPLLTVKALANQLNKSTTWVSDTLALTNLVDEIKALVDDGIVNVTNAQSLSKLPPEEQKEYLDRAINMPPNQFATLASALVKEIKDAKRQGRAPGPKVFSPQPYLQSFATIRDEMEVCQVGKSLLKTYGIVSPEDAWKCAIQWVLHMDPQSVEVEKQKDEQRKRDQEEARKARAAERAQKKQREAAEIAASV